MISNIRITIITYDYERSGLIFPAVKHLDILSKTYRGDRVTLITKVIFETLLLLSMFCAYKS